MTMTEAQKELSSSEQVESSYSGIQVSQPKPGLGVLWLAIAGLVAVVGLTLAAALGAFDSSSDDSVGSITAVDPRLDADVHRSPQPVIEGLDSDFYRETNQHASEAAAVAATDPRMDSDFHREATQQSSKAPAAVAAVDPRLDADSHRDAPQAVSGLDSDSAREINQQASKADATPHYVNGGLTSEFSQSTVDPREDSDHHREANN